MKNFIPILLLFIMASLLGQEMEKCQKSKDAINEYFDHTLIVGFVVLFVMSGTIE